MLHRPAQLHHSTPKVMKKRLPAPWLSVAALPSTWCCHRLTSGQLGCRDMARQRKRKVLDPESRTSLRSLAVSRSTKPVWKLQLCKSSSTSCVWSARRRRFESQRSDSKHPWHLCGQMESTQLLRSMKLLHTMHPESVAWSHLASRARPNPWPCPR